MKPLIAIVGRPNVGKSMLFNKLVGQRLSIVEDTPGVTRDRLYAEAEWRNRKFDLVDTGGIEPSADSQILAFMRQQAEIAIQHATVILFVCDIKTGLTASDQEVANMLLRSQKPVVLAVNKMDQVGITNPDIYEFYNLGLGDPIAVSAVHGHGTGDLLDACMEYFPPEDEEEEEDDVIKVAIIGKPNVGKSSLVNRILGEQRVIVSRVRGSYEFPADFMLCAAMNLCPCGYFPDRSRCRCTPAQVRQYMGRLSRPIMERFDICAEAAPIRYEELRQNAGDNESSAAIRVRVERAREVQAARFDGTGIRFNSRMGKGALERFCRLRPEAEHFLERGDRTRGLSARTCHEVLRVARTIADLEGSETLSKTHLAEAVGYRALEEKIWEA